MDTWKEFEQNTITHSALHHLLAIRELREKRGYARVTDVAKHLNITTGSASTNLKSLKTRQLVLEDDNRFLSLSPEGEALVQDALAGRSVFQKFLVDVLKVPPPQAEVDSCKIEHLLSPETIRRLSGFLAKHDER